MSRHQQSSSVDPSQEELEEEEVVSGEGDEVMGEAEDGEGYTSSTPTSTLTWISWFCSLPGHEYFCEVSEDFIEDDFNLTGLNAMVPFWKEAMEMVLDVEPDEDSARVPDVSIVEASAELLYGLVHQRYIITRQGLQAMADKYENAIFGSCPRVYCQNCYVVPCGRSDVPGLDTVKLYCPNCHDIYVPPSSRFQGVDGAFFGTTFAHLFFQSYRELAPAPFYKSPSSGASSSLSSARSPRNPASDPRQSEEEAFVNPNPFGGQKRAAGKVYAPRIYGFRVSERAKNGPRMMWLRMRPESPTDLDMVDWRGRWLDEEGGGSEFEEEDEEDGGDRPMEDFDPEGGDDDDEEEEEEEEAQRSHLPSSTQGDTGANRGRRRGDVDFSAASSPSLNALDHDIELPDSPEHPDGHEYAYDNSNVGFPASPASSAPPRTPEPLSLPFASVMPLRINGKAGNEAGSPGNGKVRVVRQRAVGERRMFW